MTGQAPSRPPWRSQRWSSYWCCASAGLARSARNSGASTPPAKRRGWRPGGMKQRRQSRYAPSRRPVPHCGSGSTAVLWWRPSAPGRRCCRGSRFRRTRSRLRKLRADGESERGAASVLAAVFIAIALTVTYGGVYLGAVVMARHRAQGAADLAALAGANSLPAGREQACAQADAVARAMNASVAQCTVDALDVVVTVEVAVGFARGGVGPARAGARAGPPTG